MHVLRTLAAAAAQAQPPPPFLDCRAEGKPAAWRTERTLVFANAAASRFGQQYVWGRFEVGSSLDDCWGLNAGWKSMALAAPCAGGGWELLSLEDASHCWNHPGVCLFLDGYVHLVSMSCQETETRLAGALPLPGPPSPPSSPRSVTGNAMFLLSRRDSRIGDAASIPPPDSPPEMWRANNGRKGW